MKKSKIVRMIKYCNNQQNGILYKNMYKFWIIYCQNARFSFRLSAMSIYLQ